MGGCATKPKDSKADADTPPPVDAPDPTPETAVEGDQGTPTEENRRRSLGVLFKENEENEIPSSSTDKNIIAETIKEPTVEMEVPSEPSKEHEPNAKITEVSNPIEEEETVSSSKSITTDDKPAAEITEISNPAEEVSVSSLKAITTDDKPAAEITEVSSPAEKEVSVYSPKAISKVDKPAAEITEVSSPAEKEVSVYSPKAISKVDKPAAETEVAAEHSKEHEPAAKMTEFSNPIEVVSVPSPKVITIDEKPAAETITEPVVETEIVAEPSEEHEPNAKIYVVSNPVKEVLVPSLEAIAMGNKPADSDVKTEICFKEVEVESSSDIRQGQDVSEKKVVDA